MRVATSVADITPHCPVHLCGYVGEAREHESIGVHDHPLAVSLLLEIKDKTLLFVSVDVVTIDKAKADILKDKIAAVLDVDKEYIIINAIHSHSAANGFSFEEMLGRGDNVEYFNEACNQIVASVRGLKEHLVEAKAYIGTTKVHGYYSKRTDITLPFEDHAAIIKFMVEDHVVAAMCNFNCHATVLGPENMMLSSDLIGKVRSLMADTLGVTPYTFTGASGDISNRQYRQGNDFNELNRVGEGIASILKQIDSYEELDLENMNMQYYDHSIQYDNTVFFESYQKQLEDAKQILAKEGILLDEWKMAETERLVLSDKLKTNMVDFHVSGKVIHLGELTIVTFPGELASKFGLQLREQCQTKHFLLIGYADDYQGYFIEQEEYGKTYETKASQTPCGESEKIVSEIGELL